MWIEAEDCQLVNAANVDTIFISNINDQFFLVAQKNFTDCQMAEYVLAEGSRQRIETQYNRVMDAVQSGDHFVKIYSSKKNGHKGDPEPTNAETCPDCGHAVSLHTDGGHSGFTCTAYECACSTPAWYLHGDDLAGDSEPMDDGPEFHAPLGDGDRDSFDYEYLD